MKAITPGQYTVRTTGSLRRWLVLAGLSVLVHAIVLNWVAANPILAWPSPVSDPAIAADIVQLQPAAASPAAPRRMRRAAPKKKPHHASVPAPLLAAPRPAPPQQDGISSAVVFTPAAPPPQPAKENAPPDAVAEAPAKVPAQPAHAQEESPSDSRPAYKVDPPPSVDLHYSVRKISAKGRSMSGRSKISWRRENGSYAITGEVSWLFLTALKFSSEGVLDEYGVSPVLYSQKSFRRSPTDTHFKHDRNIISFSASENNYPRVGGEQDRASIIWQLAGIGRADEGRFAPGTEFEIMVAGVRDEEPWQLRVIGKEEIPVGIGNVEAWHLVRTPKPGSYDQTLDIWLSPAHEWYPVKLRYTEPNGDHLDLDLSKISAAAPN